MQETKSNTPLLSVCLITYNHELYVRKAIESILQQEVNFSWQLIIADDYSTDNTRNILIEYKNKYPELIKLIFQEKNVGAAKNWLDLISYPKSKYISYIEGDDYFTNRLKLQKQVDFLENNPDYSIVFHDVDFINSKDQVIGNSKEFDRNTFSAADIIDGTLMASASIIYRGSVIIPPKLTLEMPYGDWLLQLVCLLNGKAYRFPEKMANYRKHSGGTHSTLKETQLFLNKIKCYNYLRSYLKKEAPDLKNKMDTSYELYLEKYILFSINHKNFKNLLNGMRLYVKLSPIKNFIKILLHFIRIKKISLN